MESAYLTVSAEAFREGGAMRTRVIITLSLTRPLTFEKTKAHLYLTMFFFEKSKVCPVLEGSQYGASTELLRRMRRISPDFVRTFTGLAPDFLSIYCVSVLQTLF